MVVLGKHTQILKYRGQSSLPSFVCLKLICFQRSFFHEWESCFWVCPNEYTCCIRLNYPVFGFILQSTFSLLTPLKDWYILKMEIPAQCIPAILQFNKSTAIFHSLYTCKVNDVKMFKTQVEPRAAGKWFHCNCFCLFMLCFSGHNCATLHYGHAGAPNDKKINDGDMWWVFMNFFSSWACDNIMQSVIHLLANGKTFFFFLACLIWAENTTATHPTSLVHSQPMASSQRINATFMKPCTRPVEL